MSEAPVFHSKYSYNHHDSKAQQLDIHEILVKRSRLRTFLSYFMVAVFLGTNVYFVTMKVFLYFNHSYGLLSYFVMHHQIYLSTHMFQWKSSIS